MSKTEIQQYIQKLANQHNVVFERGPLDDLADCITYLSDDEIVQDDTQDLLVALARAKVITGKEMNELLVRYLRAQ